MTLPPGYVLRVATPHDAALIAQQRAAMFQELGRAYDEQVAQFTPWVQPRLENGTYLGFLLTCAGETVAGVGLFIMDWPPHFLDPQPLRAYLLNVWTHPQHRGRGLARGLTGVATQAARDRRIGVLTLHASVMGRPLYETLGFSASNEMRLDLGSPA